MKKFVLQIVFLVIVIGAALGSYYHPDLTSGLNFFSAPSVPQETMKKKLDIKDVESGEVKISYTVDIADTKEKRSVGLSNRDGLEENVGMLFIFPVADKHKFWMKGMRFSLDFIWIKDNKVVDLLPNRNPPAPGTEDANIEIYAPVEPVDQLLEVSAGQISAKNIKIGDSIELKDL